VNPLVTPEQLWHEVNGDAPPVILDARWHFRGAPALSDYRQGHIPGARFVDVDTDLAGPPGEGALPLPSPAAFTEAMRRAGVSTDRPVVVYDERDATNAAARAWWLLRFFGHPDVRVLDGGLEAWKRHGLPVDQADKLAPRGDFVARPGGCLVVDADEAAAIAVAGTLIDARAPERFRGEEEPYFSVAGHVPGAVNGPSVLLVQPNGELRPREELRAQFASLGVSGGREVAAYCGAGVVAAQTILALEAIGIEAALYVGSWSDWVRDPSRQVATCEAHHGNPSTDASPW
jgi:thiosulfate/3-mercaptopyruvate sulfurtransferase